MLAARPDWSPTEQAVGFAHGVLNTDNMSILGLTLDYGPFGFMEDFEPGFICNHSDETGRYAFDQQGAIGYWNLACLAQALLPLVPRDGLLESINRYADEFNSHIHRLMSAKLGLNEVREEDRSLWIDLLNLLAGKQIDCTLFFRNLSNFDSQTENDDLRRLFCEPSAWDEWAARYGKRLAAEGSLPAERRARMNRVNPKFILRNYLAQTAIDKAVQVRDFSEIERLHQVLRRPFDEQPEMDAYALPAPDWGKRLVVSCSS